MWEKGQRLLGGKRLQGEDEADRAGIVGSGLEEGTEILWSAREGQRVREAGGGRVQVSAGQEDCRWKKCGEQRESRLLDPSSRQPLLSLL